MEVCQELREKGYKLYTEDVFQTGCYVFIPEPFMGGDREYDCGSYKLRTIIASTSSIKLEETHGGEINTSVKNLINARFQKLNIKNYELKHPSHLKGEF